MVAEFRIVESSEDLQKVFAVRAIVFCGEQNIPYNIERDGYDLSSLHILGEINAEPVAAGRIRFNSNYAKFERIAVRSSFRGQRLGHRLTDFMVSVAKQHGFMKCKMHAQAYLEEFYMQHGFKTQGERFDEAGIEHCLMVREESNL